MDQSEFPQQQLFEGPTPKGGFFTPAEKRGRISDDRQFDLKHIREVHHTMKRMCLLGYSNKEIAQATGVSVQSVGNVLGSAIMRRELELARATLDKKALDIAAEVAGMAPKALAVLEQILDDDDAPIALRAKVAMDNLSRNGVSPVQRGSLDVNHTFTAADLEEIKRNAYAAGARAGCIADEDYQQAGSAASGGTDDKSCDDLVLLTVLDAEFTDEASEDSDPNGDGLCVV